MLSKKYTLTSKMDYINKNQPQNKMTIVIDIKSNHEVSKSVIDGLEYMLNNNSINDYVKAKLHDDSNIKQVVSAKVQKKASKKS